MKPFEELTFLGRIRRMRRLAQSALNAYELSEAHLEFLRQAGNTLFRVHEGSPTPAARAEVYATGEYMLRIHQPGYQTPAAIESELEWLTSMCRDADLPVPEPVLTLDGRVLTSVSIPGIPGERICSLLRWVKGRELKREELQPHHYTAVGRLMARLHHHAAHWHPSAGLSKREYDWEGLFRKHGEDGIPSREPWSLLPPEYVGTFDIISERVKQIMDKWGKGSDVYGLIHGDVGLEANVLFSDGEARIIDFDDSGFGYYVFDLSIVLEDSQDDQVQPRFRDALLEGYTQIRPLSDDGLSSIDLFLAAYAVYWCLWAANAVEAHPEHREEILGRMARYSRLVEHYLADN